MRKPCMLLFIMLLAATLLAKQVVSYSYDDKSVNYVISSCSGTNYTANSTYEANLKAVLTALEKSAATYDSDIQKQGTDPDEVYGKYYCSRDVGVRVCTICIQDAVQRLLEVCELARTAIVWYRECTLVTYQPTSADAISWLSGPYDVSEQKRFQGVLNTTMERLINKVAISDKYRRTDEDSGEVTEGETVNCRVECSPELDGKQCDARLRSLMGDNVLRFSGNQRAWPIWLYAFYPNCMMMYYVTYKQSLTSLSPKGSPPLSQPITAGKEKKHYTPIALIVTLPVVVVVSLLLLSLAGFLVYKRNKIHAAYENMDDFENSKSLQFEISTIKTATSNFSDASKLGQGGFGSVYKGSLQNGQEIAVKRLYEKSKGGVEEFKTEVLVVAKLQHRNLVKLLGYCLSGREKLLIFEFLPNSSLDHFLYDATKRASLDWNTRYKIIVGIARGLSYLHEESRLKIIHRDLKPQNILLDENMNPKIADFGLAKSFSIDQSMANTHNIVGTYGYMSPEYAMTGHFSTKSDVYSFGVMVLEIITGNRNIVRENQPSLIHHSWKLWTEGKSLDLVDPTLMEDYSSEEAIACIHIGLLCIQEDSGTRPAMAKVVTVLNGHFTALPPPSPPLIFTFIDEAPTFIYSSTFTTNTQDKRLAYSLGIDMISDSM